MGRNPLRFLGVLALWILLPALVGAACGDDFHDGPGAGDGGDSTVLPTRVNIYIRTSIIGPGKSDGSEWDWTFSKKMVPSSILNALAQALGSSDPITAIMSLISGNLFAGLSKPDPFGVASLYLNSSFYSKVTLATESSNYEDTFTPTWPGSPGWSSVSLSDNPRIVIDLDDEDVLYNDPVGVVEINRSDIEKAYQSQKNYQVNVASQSNNQLLLVGISVY